MIDIGAAAWPSRNEEMAWPAAQANAGAVIGMKMQLNASYADVRRSWLAAHSSSGCEARGACKKQLSQYRRYSSRPYSMIESESIARTRLWRLYWLEIMTVFMHLLLLCGHV